MVWTRFNKISALHTGEITGPSLDERLLVQWGLLQFASPQFGLDCVASRCVGLDWIGLLFVLIGVAHQRIGLKRRNRSRMTGMAGIKEMTGMAGMTGMTRDDRGMAPTLCFSSFFQSFSFSSFSLQLRNFLFYLPLSGHVFSQNGWKLPPICLC